MSGAWRRHDKLLIDQCTAEQMLKVPKGSLQGWQDALFDLPSYIERDGEVTHDLHDLAKLVDDVKCAALKLRH